MLLRLCKLAASILSVWALSKMICFYSFTKRFSKGNACKFCPTERCPTRCWVLAPSSYAGRWQQALPRRPSVPGWHKGTLFHIGQSDLSMFYRNSLLSPFIDGVKAGLYSDSSLEPFGKGSSMRRSLLETCWGSPVVQGTMLWREVAAPWLNTAAEVCLFLCSSLSTHLYRLWYGPGLADF